MSLLFGDGFESADYGAWSGLSAIGTGVGLGVEAGAALLGSYGSRASINYVGDLGNEVRAYKSFANPLTEQIYAISALRFTSMTAVGYGAVGSKSVLTIRATDGTPQVWLSVRSGGVRLSYRNRFGNDISINSNIPLTLNQWTRFMLLLDRSGVDPVVAGFTSTDGTTWSLIGSATDSSVGTLGTAKTPGYVDVGISHIANFEGGSYTVEHDVVEIRDALGATVWGGTSSGQTLSAAVQRGQHERVGYGDAFSIRSAVDASGVRVVPSPAMAASVTDQSTLALAERRERSAVASTTVSANESVVERFAAAAGLSESDADQFAARAVLGASDGETDSVGYAFGIDREVGVPISVSVVVSADSAVTVTHSEG